MRLREARELGVKCVYMICDDDGNPVYIGRTKNTRKRFECYIYKWCHNTALNKWLESNPDPIVKIIEVPDISKTEIALIKHHQKMLFNKVSANNLSWQTHQTKPWMASTGIHCPSVVALMALGKHGGSAEAAQRKEIRSLRKGMSDIQRINFELDTAKDLLKQQRFRDRVNQWLDFVSDNIFEYMEKNGGARHGRTPH